MSFKEESDLFMELLEKKRIKRLKEQIKEIDDD